MKLRIRGNPVRLRLTRSEVGRLGRTGKVSNTVQFGAGSPEFCFQLSTTAKADATRAWFDGHSLTISIPTGVAEGWIGSEQVGIEELQPTGADKFLRILVEKDFACLAEREGEDDVDAFPNPRLSVMC